MTTRILTRRAGVLAAATAIGLAAIAVAGGSPLSLTAGTQVAHAAGNPGGEYHPLTPQRIFDSRPGNSTNDVAPIGAKPANPSGAAFDVQLLGVGGVPASSSPETVLAVMVSITVAEPTGAGYLSAVPSGSNPSGPTSVVNFNAGQTVPNLALVRPGAGGKLSISLTMPNGPGSAQVLVDVFGWFSTSNHSTAGARLMTVEPGRIYDSRQANDPVDAGQWVPLQIRGAQVPGRGTIVPDSPNVVGVVVNLTGANDVAGSTQTYLSAVPQQTPTAPRTSNLNLVAGQVRANLAMVPVGPDGKIHVFNEAGATHLIVDIVGYLLAGQDPATDVGRVIPLVTPFRALDTRQPAFGAAKLGPGQGEDWSMQAFVNSVKLNGQPVGAQSGVLGNITAVDLARQYPTVPVTGFLTLYPTPPSGSPPDARPVASNVNFPEGQNVANLALVKYNAEDSFRVYNGLGSTHYLFDVAAVILE